MKKKDLAKLALIGMASGYCLTADASMVDSGVNVAMHKKGDKHSDTCNGPGGCRGGPKRNHSGNTQHGEYQEDTHGRSNGSSCGGSGGCNTHDDGDDDDGYSTWEHSDEYDLAGRRRKAVQEVKPKVDDRFVGEMDEAGRKLRHRIEEEVVVEENNIAEDRFTTELDENGRRLRQVEEMVEEAEPEYGYDEAGRWREVSK